MSISGGLGPYFFRGKMEKTRPICEGMDGKVFVYRQICHFFFRVNMKKVLFPVCTLT